MLTWHDKYYAEGATDAHPCIKALYKLIVQYHLTKSDFYGLLNTIDLSGWERYRFYSAELTDALLEGNKLILKRHRTVDEELEFKKKCLTNPSIKKFFPRANLVLADFIKQVLEHFPHGQTKDAESADDLQPPSPRERRVRNAIIEYEPEREPQSAWYTGVFSFWSSSSAPESEQMIAHRKRQAEIKDLYHKYRPEIDSFLIKRNSLLNKHALISRHSNLRDIVYILFFAMDKQDFTFKHNKFVTNEEGLSVLHILARYGIYDLVGEVCSLARAQYISRAEDTNRRMAKKSSENLKKTEEQTSADGTSTSSSPSPAAIDYTSESRVNAYLKQLVNDGARITNFPLAVVSKEEQKRKFIGNVTPLMMACMSGHAVVAKELMENSADYTAQTSEMSFTGSLEDYEAYGCYDAFFFALSGVYGHSLPLISCLLDAGASPFTRHNKVAAQVESSMHFTYRPEYEHARTFVQSRLSFLCLREAVKRTVGDGALLKNSDTEKIKELFSTMMADEFRKKFSIDIFEYHAILKHLQTLNYSRQNAVVSDEVLPPGANVPSGFLVLLGAKIQDAIEELALEEGVKCKRRHNSF